MVRAGIGGGAGAAQTNGGPLGASPGGAPPAAPGGIGAPTAIPPPVRAPQTKRKRPAKKDKPLVWKAQKGGVAPEAYEQLRTLLATATKKRKAPQQGAQEGPQEGAPEVGVATGDLAETKSV